MKIHSIRVLNNGYIKCNGEYFKHNDFLDEQNIYEFFKGINILVGEIDTSIYAISYLISMYNRIDKKLLFMPFSATVNGEKMSLAELCSYSCYMDVTYPLFRTNKSVRKLVIKGLKKSGIKMTVAQIKNLFQLSDDRFERPIKRNGNEKYRAMAAVAVAYGKQIFCFPWFSKKMYAYFQTNFNFLFDRLNQLDMIVIFPTSQDGQGTGKTGDGGRPLKK